MIAEMEPVAVGFAPAANWGFMPLNGNPGDCRDQVLGKKVRAVIVRALTDQRRQIVSI
jgi:glucose uptake protein GlcU